MNQWLITMRVVWVEGLIQDRLAELIRGSYNSADKGILQMIDQGGKNEHCKQ